MNVMSINSCPSANPVSIALLLRRIVTNSFVRTQVRIDGIIGGQAGASFSTGLGTMISSAGSPVKARKAIMTVIMKY